MHFKYVFLCKMCASNWPQFEAKNSKLYVLPLFSTFSSTLEKVVTSIHLLLEPLIWAAKESVSLLTQMCADRGGGGGGGGGGGRGGLWFILSLTPHCRLIKKRY